MSNKYLYLSLYTLWACPILHLIFIFPLALIFSSMLHVFLEAPLKTFWNKLRIKHIYMHAVVFNRASNLLIGAKGLRMQTEHGRRKDVPQKSSLTHRAAAEDELMGRIFCTFALTSITQSSVPKRMLWVKRNEGRKVGIDDQILTQTLQLHRLS